MFQSLQDNLFSALKTLRGKGKLTEANMRDGLELIRTALLEADVSYEAVDAFLARVSEKALGEKVLLALDPTQQLLGIVYQELVNLLGPVDPAIPLGRETTVIMLCGLQGSGKTTTCGKLAKLLQRSGKQAMLVAADLQRPAAIEQLHVLGRQLNLPVYSEPGAQDPVKVCQTAVAKAKKDGVPIVILDTAGRLSIDEELMQQLVQVEKRVQPDQVYLVVDGMTGQDAVRTAQHFNDALELQGVIMTKLDGDARGGALLSVKHVTGVPIKFIGSGEHLDNLEPFRPEGMAQRILGQGDMMALINEVQKVVDQDQAAAMERKIQEGTFSLDDFKNQLQQIMQPGLMMKMMSLIPGMGQMMKQMGEIMPEEDAKRFIGIINSMTPAERKNPKLIDSSRRVRIAQGAGVQSQDVGALLKQYDVMSPLLKAMSGKGVGGRMQMLQELQQSGMFTQGGQSFKVKKDTGKRLTPKERAELARRREKELRRKKREEKDRKNAPKDSSNPRG